MLTPEDARKKLQDMNWSKVHRASGVKYSAIRRIALGEFDSIKATDLQKLSLYLTQEKNSENE